MEANPPGPLHEGQQKRLERFNASCCVDVHCHCLPGIDDGPSSMEESIELCRRLVKDGFTTVIATPHQLGHYDQENSGDKVRGAVKELSAALMKEDVPLEILPGADVRVDERILAMLDKGDVLTLADRRRHLLLELPHELMIDPLPLMDQLAQRGVQPIISHPERHHVLRRSPKVLRSWASCGVLVQVTAGSLVGGFGQRAQAAAWSMIYDGLVDLVATDAHDSRRRPPCMSSAIDAICQLAGRETARRLCIANPQRILDGEPIKTVVAA